MEKEAKDSLKDPGVNFDETKADLILKRRNNKVNFGIINRTNGLVRRNAGVRGRINPR